MDYLDKLDFISEKLNFLPTKFNGEEFEKSLIGYIVLPNGEKRLAYNKSVLFEELEKQGLDGDKESEDYEEGEGIMEHYYTNILGTGLTEGTPVFCESQWDEFHRDVMDGEENNFINGLYEEDKESVIHSQADSFEYDYLIVYDNKKREDFDIEVKEFPFQSAFLFKV